MKILALDTSMEACSAAIHDASEDRTLAEVHSIPGRGHAELLFAQIMTVTSEAGISLRAVDRFAVTIGPGSFTGVRTALAAARGLALATGRPLVGVGSLAAIAASVDAQRGALVVIAHDARRGELYLEPFQNGESLSDPAVFDVAEAAKRVSGRANGALIVLAGSGAGVLSGELERGGHRHRLSEAEPWPRASAVARLAAAMIPGELPAPLYLRPPDAKLPGGIHP